MRAPPHAGDDLYEREGGDGAVRLALLEIARLTHLVGYMRETEN